MNLWHRKIRSAIAAGALMFSAAAWAQDDPFADLQELHGRVDEEMHWLQAETYVITASKVLEDIKKSAASITVITDKDIRRMGARNLTDVLRTVPGFSYQLERHGNSDIDVRGIVKDGDQHILVLFNSHSLNTNYWGGISPSYLPIPVDNIQQVEVIRGPGSSLYGANAFAAVINVITKTAENADGVQISAGAGTFETKQANLLFGKKFGALGVSGNVNYYEDDGYDGYLTMDTQTQLDALLGTRASLAPGDMRDSVQKIDLMLTLEYGGFRFDGRYADREQTPNLGISTVLNDVSETPTTDYALNLAYAREMTDHFTLSGNAYHNYTFMDYTYQFFPDGAALPTPDGLQVWPDGLLGEPENKNTRTGLELQGTYRISAADTFVGGATCEFMRQYDVSARSNYFATPVKNVVIPRGAVSDVPYELTYSKNVDRTFLAAYLENLWDARDNLRLTAGMRYDHYSDFGGSFNPRAGVVWQFHDGFDAKALYGRAFRAPSFYELYSMNNPSFVGNPELNPEVVDTLELSVGMQPFGLLSGRLTAFRNSIQDSIDLATHETQDVFENGGDIRTQGIEAECKLDVGKGRYLSMNYTYQDAKNLDTGERPYNVPRHKGNVMLKARLSRHLNAYADLLFQEGFTRQPGDSRQDDNPGFAVVNATLLAKRLAPRLEGLEIRGSVYNLFDKDYTVPTPKDGLPVDFPMPGRSVILEVRYAF